MVSVYPHNKNFARLVISIGFDLKLHGVAP